MAYERTFARDNRFSWSIPVYFGKNKVSDDSYYGTSTYKNFFKVNPGIKFYPFGQKTLSYGIGLSVFYLSGQIDESYPYSFVRYQIRQLGLMLNNSLSCNVSKRINLNLEIGYGPSFYNHFENEKDHFDNYNFKINTMRHANFSIGYRF
ncbi:hypothetical protein [Edaphocola flava]|uniref:hypothetical protein n=1 Tax=Edaphocola flava TaxID=2499629 RepID=UPI0013870D2E|nr:hypothetical protein [Edaphocola flava]